MIVRSVADWVCNLLVWTAIVSLGVLSYAVFAAPTFLTGEAGQINVLICAAAVVVLSVLWPNFYRRGRSTDRQYLCYSSRAASPAFEALFVQLERRSIYPNSVDFRTTNAHRRATHRKMRLVRKEDGSVQLSPNSYSFTTALHAHPLGRKAPTNHDIRTSLYLYCLRRRESL